MDLAESNQRLRASDKHARYRYHRHEVHCLVNYLTLSWNPWGTLSRALRLRSVPLKVGFQFPLRYHLPAFTLLAFSVRRWCVLHPVDPDLLCLVPSGATNVATCLLRTTSSIYLVYIIDCLVILILRSCLALFLSNRAPSQCSGSAYWRSLIPAGISVTAITPLAGMSGKTFYTLSGSVGLNDTTQE